MAVVDAKYVLDRLPDSHGARKKLADFIGLDQPKMTKSLKGKRKFTPTEIHKIQVYFEQLSQGDTPVGEVDTPGEAAAITETRRNPEQTLAALAYDAQTPELFRATADLPGFAIAEGDLLVVDLARNPSIGDLALVALRDEDNRTAKWTVRRWLAGATLAGTSNAVPQPMRADSIDLQPRGVIVAVARRIASKSVIIENETA